MYDVIIIGGGAVGSCIARELSRYEGKFCLIEKGEDVCVGTSKANSAIVHAGFDALPGTKKAYYNVLGCERMEALSKELNFPYRKNGSLVLCFDEEEMPKLRALYERGLANGVRELSILSGDEVRAMEPAITKNCVAALYAPTAGIVCPFGMTVAMAENAAANGVEFRFDEAVLELERENGSYRVKTSEGSYSCKAVINAAGLGGDFLHNQLLPDSLSLAPRKGEYCLMDRQDGGLVDKTIFQLPGKYGKGILVTPTVHGNLLIGPTADDQEDREDTATTAAGIANVIEKANLSVPNLPLRDVITSFAGLRARRTDGEDDFLMEECLPGYFAALGIESPGLTASPAIGEAMAEMAADYLNLRKKENFISFRKGFLRPQDLPPVERETLLKEHPEYAAIVCRCEQISEGEILDAIRRTPGAKSPDGIKRRVRAGMGRCQAGFCSPRVWELLSRELGLPMEDLTKGGGKGRLLLGRTKEALK